MKVRHRLEGTVHEVTQIHLSPLRNTLLVIQGAEVDAEHYEIVSCTPLPEVIHDHSQDAPIRRIA